MPTSKPLTAASLLESWRLGTIHDLVGDDLPTVTASTNLVWLRYAQVATIPRADRTDYVYRDLVDLNDLRLHLAQQKTILCRFAAKA